MLWQLKLKQTAHFSTTSEINRMGERFEILRVLWESFSGVKHVIVEANEKIVLKV